MTGARPAAPVIAFWPWADEGEMATLDRLRAAVPPASEVLVLDRGLGFARAVNELARDAGAADLAIVADAGLVPEGWLDRLRRAAYADDSVAAATALPVGAGKPLFEGFDGDPVLRPQPDPPVTADAVHPRVTRLWPQCVFLRGSALGLLGGIDESRSHPAAALADFAARALRVGLSCALADDVPVVRIPGGLPPCSAAETATVVRSHPWLEAAWKETEALELGPLRRSLVAARVGVGSPSVTIDARAIGPDASGTQTYVAGLIIALASANEGMVRALVRDDAGGPTLDEFRRVGVELITETQAADGVSRSDIAHRPQQAFVPEDLRLLRRLGERVVITHHDLISYRNPTYHESVDEWARYRRLTRVALAACDQVVFPSAHARADAISEELIEPEHAPVYGDGIELPPNSDARRPRDVAVGRELLVMIGSDYLHKNRLFALELLAELRRRDWDGTLVLAGAHVPYGGSAAAEAELLGHRPELAAHVRDIGPVPEAEKLWLLTNAAAVLVPSTYEGFGLVPLEAAAAGTPCAYAAVTSLREVAGTDAATLVPWDAAASAERVLPLLRPGEARALHLASLRGALARYRWEAVVPELEAVYRAAIRSPYRSSVPRSWEELEREELIVLLGHAYEELRDRTEHGRPLIDERGGMLTHTQQRGLMRIAARRWLRRPVLGSIGVIGGIGYDDQGPSPP